MKVRLSNVHNLNQLEKFQYIYYIDKCPKIILCMNKLNSVKVLRKKIM